MSSATHSPVGGRSPVPRHNGQRPTDSTAESFKPGEKGAGGTDEPAGSSVPELLRREVGGEVTHAYTCGIARVVRLVES